MWQAKLSQDSNNLASPLNGKTQGLNIRQSHQLNLLEFGNLWKVRFKLYAM